MQNEMKSPKSGIIKKVNVDIGESVEQNQTLLIVE